MLCNLISNNNDENDQNVVLTVCNNMYEVNIEHSHFRLLHFARFTCLEYLILIPMSEHSGLYIFAHFFIVLNFNSVNVTLIFIDSFNNDNFC